MSMQSISQPSTVPVGPFAGEPDLGLPIDRGLGLPLDAVTRPPIAGARAAVAARPTVSFAACLAVVVVLQLWTGAYHVERGIYSDDAAHFMNGLVIRDYLTTSLGQNPMTFAENYYLSYPKIAPLMWPPLFHVTLGLLLLLGGPPAATGLLLVAATAAWLAWRLHSIVRELAGPMAGVVAAALTISTHMVVGLSSAVMLDVAIAALALEATYWLCRYARSSSLRDAMLFGVFTACACLTKGNGVAVVLVPLVFILITRRYDLLRRSGLYLAAGIVLVFAVPLLAVSARFDAAIGDFGPVTMALVIERVGFYSRHLWTQFGPLMLALSFGGLALTVRRGLKRSGTDSLPLAEGLSALVIAGLLFHLLNPHTISVSRYLMMTIGPLVGLACVAVWQLTMGLSQRNTTRILIASALILSALAFRTAPRTITTLGYRDVIGYLAERGEIAGRRLLVVSDEVGEGAFVSEAAVLGVQPVPMMIRGSKLLASDTWIGQDLRIRYASAAALLDDLEALHIDYVLLDLSDAARTLPYFTQVEALALGESARFVRELFRPADAVSGPRRSLALYRVTSRTAGAALPIEIDVKSKLGRNLAR